MSDSPARKPSTARPATSPPGSAPPGQADVVDRSELVEAYKDLLHSEKARLSGAGDDTPPVRRPFWWVMFLLLVGSVGSLLLKPEWFFPPAPKETPQIQEASLRLMVYREILRVEAFRKAQGRLPGTLNEAGGGDTGVQYSAQGDGYSLSASSDGRSVVYQSTTPPNAFLGNSYDEIRRRPHP